MLFPLFVLLVAAIQTPPPVPAVEPARAGQEQGQGQEPSKAAPQAAPKQDPKPAKPPKASRTAPSGSSPGGASGARPQAPRTRSGSPGAAPKATGEPKLKRRGS